MDSNSKSSLKKGHDTHYARYPMKKPSTPTLLHTFSSRNSLTKKPGKTGNNENNFLSRQTPDSFIWDDRALKTAPSSPSKLLASQSERELDSALKKPMLRRPQVFSSNNSNRKLFMNESLHVTGFELKNIEDCGASVDIPSDLNSSLSFGSYNTKILNYRLFSNPTKERIITKPKN
ncbi:unnamed protein product [Blepharisma stoltei]|uniref:Exophilin 5 n=1 Tax=Blepharisma stoltei TaxID=1481888 RepID=A0AAU9IVU0_9CILI|nr:unnamed protein product [Blepharisma stoltei]